MATSGLVVRALLHCLATTKWLEVFIVVLTVNNVTKILFYLNYVCVLVGMYTCRCLEELWASDPLELEMGS